MENNPLFITCKQILQNEDILPTDTDLFRFYKEYNPKTLGEIYGIEDFPHVPSDYVFIPWLHNSPVDIYRDTAFIEFSVEKKVAKLKDLLFSIKKIGYNPKDFPDRKGGITGYWLSDGNRKTFYVVSGNHRVAVLFALGKDILYRIEDNTSVKERDKYNVGIDYDSFPSVFEKSQVSTWPSVKSGFMTENQAKKIIDKYLES